MKKLMLLGGSLFAVVCVVALGLHANAVAGNCAVNIHNIQKVFDPVNCEETISWDTDVATNTNYVDWGADCTSLTNTSNAGNGHHHSTTFDVSGYTSQVKIAIRITSSSACGSETSSCQPATIGDCIR